MACKGQLITRVIDAICFGSIIINMHLVSPSPPPRYSFELPFLVLTCTHARWSPRALGVCVAHTRTQVRTDAFTVSHTHTHTHTDTHARALTYTHTHKD